MTDINVSIIQMNTILEDKDTNLSHAKELIEKACLNSPDVILLPEMFNVGFFPQNPAPIADEKDKGESWLLLSKLARKHKVNIVGGSVAIKGYDDDVLNTMYIFNRDGNEVANYSKMHLFSFSGEHKVFTPGNKPCNFTLDEIPMASIICYDLRFTELIRGLTYNGAKVLFVPAQWPHPRSDHWRTLLRARAIENQIFVVAANDCGPSGNVVNCGYSTVIDPWGQVLVEAGEEEVILNVNLDLSKVEKVRKQICVFEDQRSEIYADLYKKGGKI